MPSPPSEATRSREERAGEEDSRESVSLVFPVYNEIEVLPELLEALEDFRATRPEIRQVVLVDDGSKDGSAGFIREKTKRLTGYDLVQLSRNFGHQLAITAGIAHVTSDAAVILDADLQDPLEVVDQMVEKWKAGYDVVYGIRSKREGESVFKKFIAAGFYRFFQWMADIDMPLDTGDFRLISRNVIDTYNEIGDHQPFIRGLVTWMGYQQIGIEYVRAPRAAGESKYTFGKLLGLAMSGLTSFSEKPLRLATRFGFISTALSVLGLLFYLSIVGLTAKTLSATTLLVFSGFFFGSVQLLFLGIIGIYLIRVYGEVKGRPRYIVRTHWRSEGD